MKLFKAMFHPYLFFRTIITAVMIGVILYIIVMLYSTIVVEGILATDTRFFGYLFKFVFYLLSIIGYALSLYAAVILFPIIFTLKVSFDAENYISYLAGQYNIALSPTTVKSKLKYFFLAVFYVLISAALGLFLAIVLDDTPLEFLMLFALIPLYILIYKNWMFALKRTLGNEFIVVYKDNRGKFIRKGIFYIILMHIPFVFLFQAWFLVLFANLYFELSKR